MKMGGNNHRFHWAARLSTAIVNPSMATDMGSTVEISIIDLIRWNFAFKFLVITFGIRRIGCRELRKE